MKKLDAKTLEFFVSAGRKGGLTKNPRKHTASLKNLVLARARRWPERKKWVCKRLGFGCAIYFVRWRCLMPFCSALTSCGIPMKINKTSTAKLFTIRESLIKCWPTVYSIENEKKVVEKPGKGNEYSARYFTHILEELARRGHPWALMGVSECQVCKAQSVVFRWRGMENGSWFSPFPDPRNSEPRKLSKNEYSKRYLYSSGSSPRNQSDLAKVLALADSLYGLG